MSVLVREYWGTLSGTRADLIKYLSAQSTIYKGFRDRSSTSAMQSVLSGIATGLLSKFFLPTPQSMVAGGIALTIYEIVGAIGSVGRINNADILSYGHTVLEEIYDSLNKSSSYSRIEATVFFREYTYSDGKKVRAVYGNSDTKGKNSGAYSINRIQLTNGNWISV